MEKRVVLFLIVSIGIILGYDYLLKEMGIAPVPPPEQAETASSSSSESAPPAESAPSGASPAPAHPDAATGARLSRTDVAAAATLQASAPADERLIDVDTPLYRAVFTNRGAAIKSWELKRYMTGGKEKSDPIQLVHGGGKFRPPLTVRAPEPSTQAFAEGLYRAERDFTALSEAQPTGHLTFTRSEGGVTLTKELTFHLDSYAVDVAIRAEGMSGVVDVDLGTNFGIIEWTEGFIGLIGPAVSVDGKLEKDLPDTERELKGPVRWVALQDKYFLSVLIPKQPPAAPGAVVKKEGDKLASASLRIPAQPSGVSLQLYAGPKEYDTLKSFTVGLEDTIDFGWFIYGSWDIVRAVAKPLFYVLRFLYEYTHNYGVSIILLTVAIKLLFVPLQYKSYKSMKEMQVIQPKVLALQAKYKDDRERLNKELIKLYRDHKVNPVGGCLPMLLQTPVFVALFNILYMTIDLRQAPFILWIKDLSVQDPYYVLPILMGASMVLQQKIMPTTMDPTQAKVMLLLPAFLTILFLTFPSGLVLYWLTNNVLTIAQQFITDKYIFKKPTFSSPAPETPDDGGPDGKKKKKDKTKAEAEVEG